MSLPVLPSTVFLTFLLAVGLFFFIRASTKDRIEVVQLQAEGEQLSVLESLQHYFSQRSYRIASVNAADNQVVYEGTVRPSWFLAIFLSLLAAVGFLCLALVLAMLLPAIATGLPYLSFLGPVAGWFYWKGAGRQEQVLLQVESLLTEETTPINVLTVTAHRDELAELQRALNLKPMANNL